MFSITASNHRFSFPIQFLSKFPDLSKPNVIIVTAVVKGTISDHIFKNVLQNVDGTLVTDEDSEQTTMISTLNQIMNPEWKTLTEFFSGYDGGILAHSDQQIMDIPRKELPEDLPLLYVVTGENTD